MFKKPQQPPAQQRVKRAYRSPRLTEYGKLHAVVAAGTSGSPEGMSGKTNKRG